MTQNIKIIKKKKRIALPLNSLNVLITETRCNWRSWDRYLDNMDRIKTVFMVTPYALIRRWIQKADRSPEHKDGLSYFELKRRRICYISLRISAKSHT